MDIVIMRGKSNMSRERRNGEKRARLKNNQTEFKRHLEACDIHLPKWLYNVG